MNSYGKGICESCHFVENCTMASSGELTWECSEYEPMVIFASSRSILTKTQNTKEISNMKSSLCGYCTLKDDCCYYSPEIVILNCENVQ